MYRGNTSHAHVTFIAIASLFLTPIHASNSTEDGKHQQMHIQQTKKYVRTVDEEKIKANADACQDCKKRENIYFIIAATGMLGIVTYKLWPTPRNIVWYLVHPKKTVNKVLDRLFAREEFFFPSTQPPQQNTGENNDSSNNTNNTQMLLNRIPNLEDRIQGLEQHTRGLEQHMQSAPRNWRDYIASAGGILVLSGAEITKSVVSAGTKTLDVAFSFLPGWAIAMAIGPAQRYFASLASPQLGTIDWFITNKTGYESAVQALKEILQEHALYNDEEGHDVLSVLVTSVEDVTGYVQYCLDTHEPTAYGELLISSIERECQELIDITNTLVTAYNKELDEHMYQRGETECYTQLAKLTNKMSRLRTTVRQAFSEHGTKLGQSASPAL